MLDIELEFYSILHDSTWAFICNAISLSSVPEPFFLFLSGDFSFNICTISPEIVKHLIFFL